DPCRPPHPGGDRRSAAGGARGVQPGAGPGSDSGRGRQRAGRLAQDRAAAPESGAAPPGRAARRPPARVRGTRRQWSEARAMNGDPRLKALLEEIIETGRSPEEVCFGSPEVLPELRRRLCRLRALEAKVEALFPAQSSSPATPVPAGIEP